MSIEAKLAVWIGVLFLGSFSLLLIPQRSTLADCVGGFVVAVLLAGFWGILRVGLASDEAVATSSAPIGASMPRNPVVEALTVDDVEWFKSVGVDVYNPAFHRGVPAA